MSYKKYNLFKKLENEIIITNQGYLMQYQERLFEYNFNNELIEKVNINSLTVEEIKKLIAKVKKQGTEKKYIITYFNSYKRTCSITARTKEIAEIEFKRLFNCKVLNISELKN
jgi:hypothetical protein